MRCYRLASLFLVALLGMASAEFYSDVDSKEHDEAKALEIKAKDFWQGLMESAEGLETNGNARLGAEVDEALKTLPSEDTEIRGKFHTAIGHLAKADSMLLEEAVFAKTLARQKLESGPSSGGLFDFVSDWDSDDTFYTAVTKFVGYRTYEKRLAKQVISRLKDSFKPTFTRAEHLIPEMLAESRGAAELGHALLKMHQDRYQKDLPRELQKLARGIVTAAGKQRLRLTTYLLGSLMTTAEDMAGKDEAPSKTITKASLRGVDWEKKTGGQKQASPSSPAVQVLLPNEAPAPSWFPSAPPAPPLPNVPPVANSMTGNRPTLNTAPEKAEPALAEPPLVFFDGVPVDAQPIADYSGNVEQVVDV